MLKDNELTSLAPHTPAAEESIVSLVDTAPKVGWPPIPEGAEIPPPPGGYTTVTKDKVAICGFSTSSRDKVRNLHKDPSFEFWGMNSLWMFIDGPWDRWFETHKDHHLRQIHAESYEKVCRHYRELQIPLYMIEPRSDFPTSQRYPLEQITEQLGMHDPYFESTVAYAIAMAIAENRFSEIHLYGIDMIHDTEWGYQRPNTEFWLGYAIANGTRIVIPSNSALLTSANGGAYGFSEDTREDLHQILQGLDRQQQELAVRHQKYVEAADLQYANRHAVEGAQQYLEQVRKMVVQRLRGRDLTEDKGEDVIIW